MDLLLQEGHELYLVSNRAYPQYKSPLKTTKDSLDKLHIDGNGLDYTDYRYLRAIVNNFKGGPVGVEAVAATISEEPSTIEDVYEPFLLQEGYINRTPRGRVATEKTYKLLKISYGEGLFKDEN